jgi:hypothetical protein
MIPREFQKSHLAVELKAGRKRLEDALHGLSDERCERAGATRSGSVVDLLSEIVTYVPIFYLKCRTKANEHMDTRHRNCTITLHKRRCVDRTAQLPDGRQTLPWDYFTFARHSGTIHRPGPLSSQKSDSWRVR